MAIKRQLFVIFAAAVLVGCGQQADERDNRSETETSPKEMKQESSNMRALRKLPVSKIPHERIPEKIRVAFWRYDVSPIEALLLLRIPNAQVPFDQVQALESPPDWLQPGHISQLLEMSEDTTPCYGVAFWGDAIMEAKSSSIGVEARRMIDGYLQGRYPVPNHSYPPPDLSELRNRLRALD